MRDFDLIDYSEETDVLISLDGARFYYDVQIDNYRVRSVSCKGGRLIHGGDGVTFLVLSYTFFSDGRREYDKDGVMDVKILG